MANMRECSVLTVIALAPLLAIHLGCSAFVAPGQGHRQQYTGVARPPMGHVLMQSSVEAPERADSLRGSLGLKGLFGFGLTFGVALAAIGASVTRIPRRAEGSDIAVAEKTETKLVPYLENIPRTIIDKPTLDKLLSTLPREQWDNPPEDSSLYALKMVAETYGEGKATKMGWWDFFYLKNYVVPGYEDITDGDDMKALDREFEKQATGKTPLFIPGPAGWVSTGVTINWQGPEMFAGDTQMTPVTDGLFARQFLDNLAFYREGLKPWQRGLEIGMAHGYFIIGPFVSLGPLRNTPEAATVGLLAGVAVICIASIGGLLFGTTIKPTLFDKPGDKPAAGYQEMIQWHAIGGTGGAAFAHILITVFGNL